MDVLNVLLTASKVGTFLQMIKQLSTQSSITIKDILFCIYRPGVNADTFNVRTKLRFH